MRVFTIGHGTRPAEELCHCLKEAGVRTLVDVRRFPGSRRNPQFGAAPLAARLVAELLLARRHDVWHLIKPGRREPHRLSEDAEARDGRLYLCGELVA
jgi:uncharacterized protein DUF488